MKIVSIIFLLTLLPIQQADTDTNDDFKKLLKNCQSKDNTVRLKSILQLGKELPKLESQEDKEAAAKLLIEKTSDSNSLVNSAANLRVAQNSKTVNEFLGPFLKDKKFERYGLGCQAIKAVGPEAKKWITEIAYHLDSSERSFRLAALHALAVLDGEDLLPLLDKVLPSLDSEDFNILLYACRVMSKTGPKARKAGPRLVKLLEEGNASARSWASIALGAIGPHEQYDVVELLEQRLDRFYVIDRERALKGLAFLGTEATSTLPKIKKLMDDPKKSVQHIAAQTHWKITRNSEPAIDTLITLIPSMVHSGDTMDIIAEMGADGKKAIPEIIKQLKHPEATHREAACYALAGLGNEAVSAIQPLMEMSQDKDLLVRAVAEMAVDEIQKPAKDSESESQ